MTCQAFSFFERNLILQVMKISTILKILFKALEWLMILGLLVASGFFVKDVWKKYQSNDTSIKVSTKELNKMKDRPTITICFDPNAKPLALDDYGTNMLEFMTSRAKEPNVSVPYPELYHAVVYRVGIDFNITLKLHDKKYNFLIDNEVVSDEIPKSLNLKQFILYGKDYVTE